MSAWGVLYLQPVSYTHLHFFGEISEEIKNAVDYIVDYRRNDHNPAAPSSIIKLGMGGEIQIIRK